MKKLIAVAIVALSVSAAAHADGFSYKQKQDISCAAIADVVMAKASEDPKVGFSDKMKIYRGTLNLCMQSYDQASADYPRHKAMKQAAAVAGDVGAMVVDLSYSAYNRNMAE